MTPIADAPAAPALKLRQWLNEIVAEHEYGLFLTAGEAGVHSMKTLRAEIHEACPTAVEKSREVMWRARGRVEAVAKALARFIRDEEQDAFSRQNEDGSYKPRKPEAEARAAAVRAGLIAELDQANRRLAKTTAHYIDIERTLA